MLLQRLRVLRTLSVVMSLCLLSATIAPTLAWACEGVVYEYQGEEAGKQIAEGSTVAKVVAGYDFATVAAKGQVSCKEEYTWKKQGPAQTFKVKPSYANKTCAYTEGAAQEEVPTVSVGACEYQFNVPVFVKANEWTTSLSIINAGCEVTMEVNKGKCKIKVKKEGANENVKAVTEENNGKNLKVKSLVKPLAYTLAAGSVCPGPVGPGTLEYISEPELKNVNIN